MKEKPKIKPKIDTMTTDGCSVETVKPPRDTLLELQKFKQGELFPEFIADLAKLKITLAN